MNIISNFGMKNVSFGESCNSETARIRYEQQIYDDKFNTNEKEQETVEVNKELLEKAIEYNSKLNRVLLAMQK